MTGGATYIAATCGSEATEGWATSIGGAAWTCGASFA
jgi:hypothetical protein